VVLGSMGGPVGWIVCSLRCGFVRIRVSFWPVVLYCTCAVEGGWFWCVLVVLCVVGGRLKRGECSVLEMGSVVLVVT
jgi:hypothetical protein